MTPGNRQLRTSFAGRMFRHRTKNILFLEETGFKLHTPIKYGYSTINTDAVMYQTASRGRNISMCSIISITGNGHNEILEGSFNSEHFLKILKSCHEKSLFINNPVLVMDNVRFHHCEEIIDFLYKKNICFLNLPPYSSDPNPIENFFSCVKRKLNAISPRISF